MTTGRTKASALPDAEWLRSALQYDPETGVLVWQRKKSNRRAGSVAGHMKKTGYVGISLKKRFYLAHRVAWKIVTGEEPPRIIDHIDGDRANNKWDNLRAATHSQNLFNMKFSRANTSGYRGVTWSKEKRRWTAQISVLGKHKFLGYFDCPIRAHNAYLAAAAHYFGEYARRAS